MKIIDIIKNSAELLDLHETIDALNTATEENEQDILVLPEVQRLMSLSALAIQELCSNYISVHSEQEIETTECSYPLKNLVNYIRINSISENENNVKFKIVNRNIVVEKDGKYLVKYCSFPSITSLFEEIDFLNNFSPDVLVMAVCAYYAVAHGMFNEFELYHDKYLSKAQALKELKIFEMPLRRWEWNLKE